MALFEGYERRIDKINVTLDKYGIKSVEDAGVVCKEKGLDVYKTVKDIQPIAFENAMWSYTVGAAIAITIGSLVMNQPERPKQRELTSMSQIPAGNYMTHDGSQVALSTFWIDCHEVTIADYALFLETMEILSRQQISIYEHEDQPESKRNHQPYCQSKF